MATTESNSFEIERRVVLFKSTTTLPDGSSLGYNGNPNNVINGNTDGETLIYNCPRNTRYSEDDGVEWTKKEVPNSWIRLSSMTLLDLDDTPGDYAEGEYLRSTSSGTEWTTISGAGTIVHTELSNLDYASSGHTGFASSDDLTTVSGMLKSEIDVKVSDEAYSSDWNGVVEKASSKNAVYAVLENRMVVGALIDGGSF